MTSLPLHPQIVHFPLALAMLVPVLALIVALMVQRKKWPAMVWILVTGLQVLTTVSGYVAMELGEDDEEVVEQVVSDKALHEHEEKAEMFIALSVAASAVSVAAFLIKPAFQFYLMLATLVVMLGQSFFAINAGHSGGELVYVHKAANAFKMAPAASSEDVQGSDTDQDDNDYAASEAVEDDSEDDGEEEAED